MQTITRIKSTIYRPAFWAKPLLQLAILSSLSADLFASVVVWDGGAGDDEWTSSTNWVGDALPTAGDIVEFSDDFGAGSTTLFLNGNQSAEEMMISTATDFLLIGSTLSLGSGDITRTATTGQTWITSKIVLGGDANWSILGRPLLKVELYFWGRLARFRPRRMCS